jgi:fructoselysine-6-P-deglycase FrlB-like protein
MNSINAMYKEIRYQVDYLSKLDVPGQVNLDNCLFIGAGDSYVTALIARYASHYKVGCCNPMDIVFNPEIIQRNYCRKIYIVSVSGNTQSNILAAKISRRYNVSTTAITAAPDSNLARNCDEVIELNYKHTGITTSGTISFMSSMLCCLSLARKIDDLSHSRRIYTQSYNEARNLINTLPERIASYIFLGDGILFPVAVYGTLKINEVFGLKSFAYPSEEFCHSPLFSLKRNDKIIIFASKKVDLARSGELNDRLTKLGFSSAYIVDCSRLSLTELLLKSTLIMQLFAVKQALRKGLKDCFFLKDKGLLKLSSDFIYHR